MDKLVSLLQSFFDLNKVASVSLPGLLSAVAIIMLLWPPVPIDVIPTVSAQDQLINQFPPPIAEACKTGTSTLEVYRSLSDLNATAVRNQQKLDDEKQRFAQCINLETSRIGFEKTSNDHLTAQVGEYQKVYSAAQENYLVYLKSNGALALSFRQQRDDAAGEIEKRRTQILQNEQNIRERERRVAELTRQAGIINDRLADPARLRPRRTIDDFLAGLVNHVVAFLLLALVLGVLMTPVNQAAAGVFFDKLLGGVH